MPPYLNTHSFKAITKLSYHIKFILLFTKYCILYYHLLLFEYLIKWLHVWFHPLNSSIRIWVKENILKTRIFSVFYILYKIQCVQHFCSTLFMTDTICESTTYGYFINSHWKNTFIPFLRNILCLDMFFLTFHDSFSF